jgi:hypothetical protein
VLRSSGASCPPYSDDRAARECRAYKRAPTRNHYSFEIGDPQTGSLKIFLISRRPWARRHGLSLRGFGEYAKFHSSCIPWPI